MSDFQRMLNGRRKTEKPTNGTPNDAPKEGYPAVNTEKRSSHNDGTGAMEESPRSESAQLERDRALAELPPRAKTTDPDEPSTPTPSEHLSGSGGTSKVRRRSFNETASKVKSPPLAPHADPSLQVSEEVEVETAPQEDAPAPSVPLPEVTSEPANSPKMVRVIGVGESIPRPSSPPAAILESMASLSPKAVRVTSPIDGRNVDTAESSMNHSTALSPGQETFDVKSEDSRHSRKTITTGSTTSLSPRAKESRAKEEYRWNLNLSGMAGLVQGSLPGPAGPTAAELNGSTTQMNLSRKGSRNGGSFKSGSRSKKPKRSGNPNDEGIKSPVHISHSTESIQNVVSQTVSVANSRAVSPKPPRTFVDCMKAATTSLASSDRNIDRAAWIEAAQVHNLFAPHQIEMLHLLNKLPESLTERVEAVSEKLAKGGDKSILDSFLDSTISEASMSPRGTSASASISKRLGGARLTKDNLELNHSVSSPSSPSGVKPPASPFSGKSSSSGMTPPQQGDIFEAMHPGHSLLTPSQRRPPKPSETASNTGRTGDNSTTSQSDNTGGSSAPSVTNTRSGSSGTSRTTMETDYGFGSFVSELALSSFQLSVHDEPVCVEVDVDATLLFIDISGYSKVSAALEARGAYTLFSIVNAYVSQLVDLVVEYGGQVIKFAGDAIKCIWYYRDLGDSARCAVHCAKALQERCGRHPIPESEMTFSIHIGVVAGRIRSTVFRSSTVKNMESAYHLISGEPLHLIGDVVDAAKSGEICVSSDVQPHLCSAVSSHFRCKSHKDTDILVLHFNTEDDSGVVRPSNDIQLPEFGCGCIWGSDDAAPETHYLGDVELDMQSRQEYINAFISPKIAMQLRKGKSQSEMAEMKLLTVLFIHKTEAEIDIADWFEEVQHVVDQFRCAIVQIIEDDKGVHIIAAVNLFLADREPAATGIQLADALINRQCGCTIGLATGVTFCGVVGNTNAARFDITGNVCVRACRLMQFAVSKHLPVAIGESVVQYSGDQSMTMPLGEGVFKGVIKPVKIFGIAKVDTSVVSSITQAAAACHGIQQEHCDKIRGHVVDRDEQRSAVVVRGSSNSGKGVLCARAMYNSGFVVISHTGVQDSRPLDVLLTIGKWFSYHRDPEISGLARDLLNGLQMNHNIRSTAIALRLVNTTVSKGMRNVILIKQCQRLDAMSMSFLRQSVQQRVEGEGRWGVLATVVPQPGTTAWSAIATTLGSDTLTLRIGHLTEDEVNAFIAYRLRWRCDKDLAQAIRLSSGWLVGLLEVVCLHLESMGEGKMTVSTAGEVRATDELRKHLLMSEWAAISRKVCAKSAQLISGLSMSAHTVLKVIAVLSNPFLPVKIQFAASVSAALLEGIRIKKVIKEIEFLIDMYFLEKREPTAYRMYSHGDGASNTEEYVTFESPALLNVILETVLPAERVAMGKAAANFFETYHELDTCHCHFALGHHHHNAGSTGGMKDHMRQGLEIVEQSRSKWEPEDLAQLRVVVAVETRKRGVREIVLTVPVAKSDGSGSQSPNGSGANLTRAVSVSLESTIGDSSNEKNKRMSVVDRLKKAAHYSTRELPPHIIELKTWRPPMGFGALTICLRATSIFITELAVNAAQQKTTPKDNVKAHWTRVNTYVKFKEQVDRVIGFEPELANEKEFLIRVGTPTTDFNEVCAYGREFLEYVDLVIEPRAKRLKEHVMTTMYVPYAPSYKPVFAGNERESLKTALQNALAHWDGEGTASLRDGLMEMATQGWVPKNAEMNIEYQRDCYLRKRIREPEAFLCFLFVNLSISTI